MVEIVKLTLEKNNFSQYGGWVLNGYQGRHSMYTRDREGIVDIPMQEGDKNDVQASSCMKHILFGHGPQVRDVIQV